MCSQPLKEKHTPLRWEELEGLAPPQRRRMLLERMASSVEGRARFWEKAAIGNPDDCWNWQGWINHRYGYYVIRVYLPNNKGKNFNFEAHRVSFLLSNNHLPEDLLICHHCDNRRCVNPKHLFVGTYMDNMVDKINKGRQSVGKAVNAKLSPSDVYKIRQLLSEGVPKYKIAPQFGVHASNLIFIERRQTWKYLPEDPMNDPMF